MDDFFLPENEEKKNVAKASCLSGSYGQFHSLSVAISDSLLIEQPLYFELRAYGL